ncbi:hypothetical protein [Amycolatopsis anabasis]|uniref:hypothetical protein n=1 Tax=Amycolatopsis anabasis TaxID=1840409 RepID=UPI00131A799A|nr:hypothetical protein [Amycolatopsis anabasis]
MTATVATIRAGKRTDRLTTGTVLIADELVCPGRDTIPCPASVLLEGELRRRGVPTARGALHLDTAELGSRPAVAFTAVLPTACGGQAGLGVAAGLHDRSGRLAAGIALADWLSAAQSRTVLLARRRPRCAGNERAFEIVERVLVRSAADIEHVDMPDPRDSDLVLVAGLANSAHSRRLVETARRRGTPAYPINGPEDIRPSWLSGVDTVGLTAGAATPGAQVDEVLEALGGLGPLQVTSRGTGFAVRSKGRRP